MNKFKEDYRDLYNYLITSAVIKVELPTKKDSNKYELNITTKLFEYEKLCYKIFPYITQIVRDDNIIYTSIESNGNLYLLYRKCDGDILNIVKDSIINKTPYIFNNDDIIKNMLNRMYAILNNLSNIGYHHCDIKPANILYIKKPDAEYEFYLADIGSLTNRKFCDSCKLKFDHRCETCIEQRACICPRTYTPEFLTPVFLNLLTNIKYTDTQITKINKNTYANDDFYKMLEKAYALKIPRSDFIKRLIMNEKTRQYLFIRNDLYALGITLIGLLDCSFQDYERLFNTYIYKLLIPKIYDYETAFKITNDIDIDKSLIIQRFEEECMK